VADSLKDPDADLRIGLLVEKLEFAAGSERVATLDAQRLAEDFLGDSIYSNIVALGCAWQRALVPVSHAALMRAIELNGVAVDANKRAFAIGRLHAADPAACAALLQEHTPAVVADESLDALIAGAVARLGAYQSPAYAQRFVALVEAVREREQGIAGHADALPLSAAVARNMLKLMTYKDEYEVARLYTDGEFERHLKQQFEGDYALEFYLAPPALARPRDGRPPAKKRFGPWMFHVLKLLARGRVLRGTPFDPFGRTAERRMERRLMADYEARIRGLIARLPHADIDLCIAIAQIPQTVRGFGHVKIANLALARVCEAELLHRLDPRTYPRPKAPAVAGQLRGIPVVAAGTQAPTGGARPPL
jgi:indolepyruvate ferredoxin oxidoreductase